MGEASAGGRVTGTTLDTGALLAIEKGTKRMLAFLELAYRDQFPVAIPAGVVAQAWRGGARQARIARLLNAPMTEVVSLDEPLARVIGVACGEVGVQDIVDVSVAMCAKSRDQPVITSDPGDLRAIDPKLTLVEP